MDSATSIYPEALTTTSGFGSELPEDIYKLAKFRFGFRSARAVVNIAAIILSVAILVSSRWLHRPASPLFILNLHVLLVNILIAIVHLFFYGETVAIDKFAQSEFHCTALLAQFAAATALFVASLNLLTVAISHAIELYRPLIWLYSTRLSKRRAFGVIALEWFGAAIFFTYFYLPRTGFTSGACQSHSTEVFDTKALLIITTFVTAPFGLSWVLYCVLIISHCCRSPRYTDVSRNHLYTSLCVLITFSMGFLPDLIFAILFCEHCRLYGSDWDSYYLVMAGDMARTALISTKFVLDPIIYIWRIWEVRLSLLEMVLCRRRTKSKGRAESPENGRSISIISTSIIGYYEY
ncbi:adrenocorticotropic hormone receptor-like [Tropilaelaps mercedesae]|uniref:Adrenocorticotropic hormone receptor-like n=1 Tax=Tropilaelaps mercedesae TaxID=418985 RepID=A0A1V9X3J0_9ACAR|nr:adrenocorticotropic hormone receptor-like [Tropilaelaps mercedesae]